LLPSMTPPMLSTELMEDMQSLAMLDMLDMLGMLDMLDTLAMSDTPLLLSQHLSAK